MKLTANRPDAELRSEIAALIENSASLANSRVEVNVTNHEAKLAGYVGAACQIDTLRSLASLPGTTKVDLTNVEIDTGRADDRLRGARRKQVADSSIEEALRRALRFDPLLASYADALDIRVDHGNVSLFGDVGRLRAKRAAVQVANNTVGVRHVSDKLNVAWTGKELDDVTIIKEAVAAIGRSAYLQRHEIRVHCRDAHLQLYGLVDSEFEKQIATWICDGLKGVVHVANYLAVPEGEQEQRSDEEIKSALEKSSAELD